MCAVDIPSIAIFPHHTMLAVALYQCTTVRDFQASQSRRVVRHGDRREWTPHRRDTGKR